MSELINFLCKEENLKLDDDDLKIIRKQKVNDCDFLKITEEKLICHPYNLPEELVSRLADFTKELSKQKLKSFLSYCSLKEVLAKYSIKSSSITSIPQFELRK